MVNQFSMNEKAKNVLLMKKIVNSMVLLSKCRYVYLINAC